MTSVVPKPNSKFKRSFNPGTTRSELPWLIVETGSDQTAIAFRLVSIRGEAVCSGIMKAMPILTAVVLGAALIAVPVLGWSQTSSPTQDDGVKHDLKAAGHDTKDAAKDTGHDVKKGTVKAAHATEKGTKTAAKDTGKAAHATEKGTKEAAHATTKDTKEAAHATAHGTKKVWDKTKNTTKGAVDGAKQGADKKTE